MRCARRQNDAAYQQYRRRSVSGRYAIIIHRRQVQHQSSRGMFLTLWMARLPLRHRPVVLRSPVNGSESAIGRGCIRATGWDAFILKPLLRVPYVYSAYRTQPKYNILTSTRLDDGSFKMILKDHFTLKDHDNTAAPQQQQQQRVHREARVRWGV